MLDSICKILQLFRLLEFFGLSRFFVTCTESSHHRGRKQSPVSYSHIQALQDAVLLPHAVWPAARAERGAWPLLAAQGNSVCGQADLVSNSFHNHHARVHTAASNFLHATDVVQVRPDCTAKL